jgi:inhibitor of the pro-sigma K processing machinery
MEKETGILIIVGACILVLFMVLVKNKIEFVLNFCLRAIFGGIAIYGINFLLEKYGFSCTVGINLCSFLTSGTLGISGVSLLYAVSAFHLL